jgi:hypothetical protein
LLIAHKLPATAYDDVQAAQEAYKIYCHIEDLVLQHVHKHSISFRLFFQVAEIDYLRCLSCNWHMRGGLEPDIIPFQMTQ